MREDPDDHDEEEPAGVEDHEGSLGRGGNLVFGHVVYRLASLVPGGVLQGDHEHVHEVEAELGPLQRVEGGEDRGLAVIVGQLSHGIAPPVRGETFKVREGCVERLR